MIKAVLSFLISASGLLNAQQTATSANLLAMHRVAPFRAKVTGRILRPDSISISLACTDGRTIKLQHRGKDGMDEARRIAQSLEEGHFYEFPLSVEAPYQNKTAPPSPDMKPLDHLIGEWEGSNLPVTSFKVRVRWLWKTDGSGMWRETLIPSQRGDQFIMASAILITFDSTAGHYREIFTDPAKKAEIEMTWNPNTRTLVGIHHADEPEPGCTIASVSTFPSHDRIEWKMTITSKEGKIIEEIRGCYDRIKS